MALEVLLTASAYQSHIVRKMTIYRYSTYIRPFGYITHRRSREPLGLVQVNRRINDLLPGSLLALAALLELV